MEIVDWGNWDAGKRSGQWIRRSQESERAAKGVDFGWRAEGLAAAARFFSIWGSRESQRSAAQEWKSREASKFACLGVGRRGAERAPKNRNFKKFQIHCRVLRISPFFN